MQEGAGSTRRETRLYCRAMCPFEKLDQETKNGKKRESTSKLAVSQLVNVLMCDEIDRLYAVEFREALEDVLRDDLRPDQTVRHGRHAST